MSMVQFNLLPDVKIAYIKAQQQKRLVLSISTIAGIASIVIFIVLFSFVNGLQKKNMSDLTTDIATKNKKLMETKDLTKILTVQNQLNSLPALHDQKVVSSRMFSYIQEVTPSAITISQLDADYVESTVSVSGSAPSLAAVNTFADALKFTKFTTEADTSPRPAFTEVVLSTFSVSEKEQPQYTLTFKYDAALFSQTEVVKLAVPSMVTTRSAVERPSALFQSGGN